MCVASGPRLEPTPVRTESGPAMSGRARLGRAKSLVQTHPIQPGRQTNKVKQSQTKSSQHKRRARLFVRSMAPTQHRLVRDVFAVCNAPAAAEHTQRRHRRHHRRTRVLCMRDTIRVRVTCSRRTSNSVRAARIVILLRRQRRRGRQHARCGCSTRPATSSPRCLAATFTTSCCAAAPPCPCSSGSCGRCCARAPSHELLRHVLRVRTTCPARRACPRSRPRTGVRFFARPRGRARGACRHGLDII